MIKSLTGIRFWLFLSILVNHIYTNIIVNSEIGRSGPSLFFGPFAVLFFFVLSGFCIAINNFDKFANISFNSIKNFMVKKIVKFYPLYILTGLIILVFHYIPLNLKWIYKFVFLYVPMLQPYTHWHSCGGNGTAWFLAALMLCYFVTPFVLCFINNYLKNLKRKMIAYFILYIVLILLSVLLIKLHLSNKSFDYLYYFPPIRVLHYLAGLILGAVYAQHIKEYIEKSINFIKKSFMDIFVSVLFLLALIIDIKSGGVPHVHGKSFPVEQIIGIPVISIVILYLSNASKSILSYILENKIVLYLGSISFECWLIHYVFIVFLKQRLISYCNNYIDVFFIAAFLLLLTVIFVFLYKCTVNKIIKTKLK
jgi:peptidoglycan/LPS O-acetylase OafA/YrhL